MGEVHNKRSKRPKKLELILVASRKHLSRTDISEMLKFLESKECNFEVSLQLSDPTKQPELLELHRLVAVPALIKIFPEPKQIFAGSHIYQQLKNWVPKWENEALLNGKGINLRPSEFDKGRTRDDLLLEDELLVLRQENDSLSEKIKSQERLLRMVAHELRTPLSVAVLAIQSQELGQINNERFKEVIKRRLEDIELLSQDLLEVGSIRWEALFNPQKTSLGKISADVLLELEKLWLKRGIQILTDIPADLPDVLADQRRMRQVLLNLIENAVKFSQDNGKIFITMLHKTTQWIEVSVCDKGLGIPEQEQKRIFFDRVRLPQTSDETPGYGIGLSVCRRIVEVHGGKIWVVSKPGEGSCFNFTVPVWADQNK